MICQKFLFRITNSRGGTSYGAGGGKYPQDFDARGQDYIVAVALFDSFSSYSQLKFVENQRITRTKLSALMFATAVRHVLCTRIDRNDKGPNIDCIRFFSKYD